MKKITAKFNSICAETGAKIKKGESMYYDYSTKKCYCLDSNTALNIGYGEDRGMSISDAQEMAYFDNFCQRNNL